MGVVAAHICLFDLFGVYFYDAIASFPATSFMLFD